MGFGPPIGFGELTLLPRRDAGLPHAGVPGHLQDEVKRVLKQEPIHELPPVDFDYFISPETPFTLRSFLGDHKWKLILP